ncbi:MAG: CBS domain-containing protein [Bacilli bacterium]|jgi:CBS domain-containing protein|nr:CBS domain-containing protein [Bacilli bacterium]
MATTRLNVLFFLLPKNKVAYVEEDFTVRQAIEKMEHYHYSAIPILTKNGEYLATISEGDLLWFMKTSNIKFEETSSFPLKAVKINKRIEPISINNNIEDLALLIANQNFVPVEDDRGLFIGIITRKTVIEYLLKNK